MSGYILISKTVTVKRFESDNVWEFPWKRIFYDASPWQFEERYIMKNRVLKISWTFGFVMLSGGTEMEHLHEMGLFCSGHFAKPQKLLWRNTPSWQFLRHCKSGENNFGHTQQIFTGSKSTNRNTRKKHEICSK